jgi:hypothetical protein
VIVAIALALVVAGTVLRIAWLLGQLAVGLARLFAAALRLEAELWPTARRRRSTHAAVESLKASARAAEKALL